MPAGIRTKKQIPVLPLIDRGWLFAVNENTVPVGGSNIRATFGRGAEQLLMDAPRDSPRQGRQQGPGCYNARMVPKMLFGGIKSDISANPESWPVFTWSLPRGRSWEEL